MNLQLVANGQDQVAFQACQISHWPSELSACTLSRVLSRSVKLRAEEAVNEVLTRSDGMAAYGEGGVTSSDLLGTIG